MDPPGAPRPQDEPFDSLGAPIATNLGVVAERLAGFRIGSGVVRQGRAMSQRIQSPQSKDREKVWLSALVETMEELSRSGSGEKCDDRTVLDAV